MPLDVLVFQAIACHTTQEFALDVSNCEQALLAVEKNKSITRLALCGSSFPPSVIGLPDSQLGGGLLVHSRPPLLQHQPQSQRVQKIHRDEQVEQQVVQGEDDGEHAEVDGEPVRAARAQCDNQPNRRPSCCRF